MKMNGVSLANSVDLSTVKNRLSGLILSVSVFVFMSAVPVTSSQYSTWSVMKSLTAVQEFLIYSAAADSSSPFYDWNRFPRNQNSLITVTRTIKQDSIVAPTIEKSFLYRFSGSLFQSNDLWHALRINYALPDLKSSRVEKYVRYYSKRPEMMDAIFTRARYHMPYIFEQVLARGLPAEIALLPIVESSYNPYAYSSANAAGLWQFLAATGKDYGLTTSTWHDGRRDVIMSTQAALDYLQDLHEEFNGDWLHALAAYNAGSSRVRKAIQANVDSNKSISFEHLKLSKETRFYVPKLVAIAKIVANPDKFGIQLPPMSTDSYFEVVDVEFPINLNYFVTVAGITRKDFVELNPGFRRTVIQQQAPNRVLVPKHMAEKIRVALNSATPPAAAEVEAVNYKIQPGDYLGKIANIYDVSVKSIKLANNLHSDFIRAGDELSIPTGNVYPSHLVSKSIDPLYSPQRLVHRVTSGDTLWGIARQYDVRLASLLRWNDISKSSYIRPGQRIVVYVD